MVAWDGASWSLRCLDNNMGSGGGNPGQNNNAATDGSPTSPGSDVVDSNKGAGSWDHYTANDELATSHGAYLGAAEADTSLLGRVGRDPTGSVLVGPRPKRGASRTRARGYPKASLFVANKEGSPVVQEDGGPRPSVSLLVGPVVEEDSGPMPVAARTRASVARAQHPSVAATPAMESSRSWYQMGMRALPTSGVVGSASHGGYTYAPWWPGQCIACNLVGGVADPSGKFCGESSVAAAYLFHTDVNPRHAVF